MELDAARANSTCLAGIRMCTEPHYGTEFLREENPRLYSIISSLEKSRIREIARVMDQAYLASADRWRPPPQPIGDRFGDHLI